VLTLYAPGLDAFSPEHGRVVELVARQIATGIARAMRFEQQRAVLLRDGVTGLPNGRSLDQLVASRAFTGAQMVSFGVLCFAVDGSAAEPSGSREQLVCRVASATRQVLRASDLVFRYSDEELVILMPDADPAVTARVAQRILLGLLDEGAADAQPPLMLGVAFAPNDGASIDDLLKTARTRLERQQWVDVAAHPPRIAFCTATGGPA
jgi:diguanylate cyclase (GGDEF)-like protein